MNRENFEIYSAQTGSVLGTVQAASEREAVDRFANSYGWSDAKAMWKAGSFEYASARQLPEGHPGYNWREGAFVPRHPERCDCKTCRPELYV